MSRLPDARDAVRRGIGFAAIMPMVLGPALAACHQRRPEGPNDEVCARSAENLRRAISRESETFPRGVFLSCGDESSVYSYEGSRVLGREDVVHACEKTPCDWYGYRRDGSGRLCVANYSLQSSIVGHACYEVVPSGDDFVLRLVEIS